MILLLAACASPKPAPPVPPPAVYQSPPSVDETAMIESIEETTVGDLDGTPVPMGNMTVMDYDLPDGRSRHGLVCSLALPGQIGTFVGLGSVIQVGDARWEVVGIEKPDDDNGEVTLKKLD